MMMARSFNKRQAEHWRHGVWVPAFAGTTRELHHNAQPLRGSRDPGIKPPRAAVLKCKALVEQHHVVPLRALRFVHREHIAVIELVIRLALFPRDGLDAALEAIVAHRDL